MDFAPPGLVVLSWCYPLSYSTDGKNLFNRKWGCHCTQPFIPTISSSLYVSNTVGKDIKNSIHPFSLFILEYWMFSQSHGLQTQQWQRLMGTFVTCKKNNLFCLQGQNSCRSDFCWRMCLRKKYCTVGTKRGNNIESKLTSSQHWFSFVSQSDAATVFTISPWCETSNRSLSL